MITMKTWAAGACALALCTAAGAARADSVADFYKGKTIQFFVGYEAGSGYDLYARLLARHYGAQIPGRPGVVVQNMPGAGSIKAANYLYEVAPRDGTQIGMTSRGTPMTPLLGGKGATFKDDRSFTWIGSMNNEVSVCAAWEGSGVKTIEDAMHRELTTSATSLGADDTTVFPAVLNAMIGTKFRWITGYPGGAAMNLAMERGEAQGRCGWSWSSVKSTQPEWLRDGKISLLLQLSLTKHPDLPDLPGIMDFAKTDEQRAVLELIFARQVMGRPVLAPPALPPERTQALRRAFDATMKDPAFMADADKGQWEINLVTGEEIEALMAKLWRTPPHIVELAKEITPQPH
jgi:tripartite-type tricarboxylate transporter receptor subunit TctC